MAQTGFTPIQLYSTSTAAAAPAVGNLTNSTLGSELAINITDGKLFYKDNANAVQVIAWKTTPTTAGGTGLTSYTAGDLSYYASGTTLTKLAIGTIGQILTSTGSAPQWSTLSGIAVTTFSAGTTGFTPNSATSGAVTLAGTLATTNGGTGLTSFTANGVFYASSTSVIAQSASLTFSGTTLTSGNYSTGGNLTFTGTGNRITGDFSSANTNAVTFQSSTVNGVTALQTIPNGTSVQTNLILYNGTDFANYSRANIRHNTTSFTLTNQVTGSGVYVPFIIETSGAEKFRIAADTTGTYTFGGTAPRITGDFSNATVANRVAFQTSTTNGNSALLVIPNGTATTAQYQAINNSDPTNSNLGQFAMLSTDLRILSNILGTASYLPITFYVGGPERMRLFTSGGVSIGNTTDPGATNLSVTGTGKFGTTVGVGAATPATSGAGITFPATQSASTDVNTLDDYEEGTWTPADASGASLTFTSVTARYTKIGNVVHITADLTYPTTADVSQAKISGLPFAPAVSGVLTFANPGVVATGAGFGWTDAASTTATLVAQNNTSKTNANLSTLRLYFTGTYIV
jgi:hypothetical protein